MCLNFLKLILGELRFIRGQFFSYFILVTFILCVRVEVFGNAGELSGDKVSKRQGERVILLHGLLRTSRSMKKMKQGLARAGYLVTIISYPSRKHRVEELAVMVRREIESQTKGSTRVHFITHSLGGIILRYIQKTEPLENLGRVVMLSPPNGGSEVVNKWGGWPLFRFVNGPAILQLAVGSEFLMNLGAVDFELGVIAGSRSINLILSLLIPGTDDGKVAVRNAKVKGMRDFLVFPTSHALIMQNAEVIEQCAHFLRHGRFKRVGVK